MLSTSSCTFAKVLSTKTASDCSLTYFRPFHKLGCSGLTWLNEMKPTKNHYWVLFHSAKSISNHFRTLKKCRFFFSKIQNSYMCWPPILPRWTKMNSTKNHMWVLFHSAKSNSYHFRTFENFEKFLKFFEISFRPLYCIGEKKVKSTKNYFWVLFHSAKSLSDHFRIEFYLKNFRKKFKIFNVMTPILHRWKREINKKTFLSALS